MERPQVTSESDPSRASALSGAKLYSASIVSVDVEAYQMRVFHEGTSEPIEIPSPYFNVRDGRGRGFHIIPEVGAEVWILESSDGKKVPLCYHGVIGDSYRNNRPPGIEGDIHISTKDDNGIKILRGGSVSIEAGAVCKMLLEPQSDTITSFSSQSKSYTLSCVAENVVTDRDAQSIRKYFMNADHKEPVVESIIGSVSGGSRVYFSSKSTPDGDPNLKIAVKEDGNIVLENDTVSLHSTLVNVGSGDKDFLVKSTDFLQDLSSVLDIVIAMGTALNSLGVSVNTASALAMKTSITSGNVYPSTKLKTE